MSGDASSVDERVSNAISTSLKDRFAKKHPVGRGAYGEVWLIERLADNAKCVAKVMQTEKQHRFEAEVRCLASCQHFAIIRLIETVMSPAGPVIILEFSDGGDLSALLKRTPPQQSFDEQWIGTHFVQLALALHHIHSKRMIHRDIKCANILLTQSGLCKLSDFGFSKTYDSTVSQDVAETFLGTPYYLAPELWKRQKYNKKADVWSLGVVLYEMMLRKRPFVSSNMRGLMNAIVSGDYAPIGQTPYSAELIDILQSMLKVDPAQRCTVGDILCRPLMRDFARRFLEHVAASPVLSAEEKGNIASTVEYQLQAASNEQGQHDQEALDEEPQREVHLLEGPMLIGSLKEWKQRYVVLSDTAIVVSRVREDKKSQKLDLSTVVKVGLPQLPDGNVDTTIMVVYLTSGFSVWMKTSSEEERDLWLATCSRALKEYNERS